MVPWLENEEEEEEAEIEVLIDAEENLMMAGVQRLKETVTIKRSTTAANLCQLVQVLFSFSLYLIGKLVLPFSHYLLDFVASPLTWDNFSTVVHGAEY